LNCYAALSPIYHSLRGLEFAGCILGSLYLYIYSDADHYFTCKPDVSPSCVAALCNPADKSTLTTAAVIIFQSTSGSIIIIHLVFTV